MDSDEIPERIANMLLHGVARTQMRRDLGIDFVPEPPDLPFQGSPQRGKLLVECLRAAGDPVRPAHALVKWQAIKRQRATATMNAAAARMLDDNARHVSTHGSAPVKRGTARDDASTRRVAGGDGLAGDDDRRGVFGSTDARQAPPPVNGGVDELTRIVTARLREDRRG
ncbi:MAG: hypothetical protein AB7H90_24255 [Alphaproteobacteria bacterium]